MFTIAATNSMRKQLSIAVIQLNAHHGTDIQNTIRRADNLVSELIAKCHSRAAMESLKPHSSSAEQTAVLDEKVDSYGPVSRQRDKYFPDILILPELAFTGYAYPSKSAISSVLEPTAGGPSTRWCQKTAKLLGCHVIIGYPELAVTKSTVERQDSQELADIYNAAVVVDPSGKTVFNYRKHFLYEADKKWGAVPGPDGFGYLELQLGQFESDKIKVGLGICMDLNPREFEAPFMAYEFARFCVDREVDLILMPMAWLASDSDSASDNPTNNDPEADIPEFDTVRYWATRLTPIMEQYMTSNLEKQKATSTAFIACNRCGVEDGHIVYAGSSCGLLFKEDGSAQLIDCMGKRNEGVKIFTFSL
ncbi:carbon-nitrogen hydrolase [Lipomyces oligophaga]|uniref:carbon-nitrogen hydrolase n=1 Tax=Lipomyces oligophaga TaxID=45792 RepID=UPI0034CD93A1